MLATTVPLTTRLADAGALIGIMVALMLLAAAGEWAARRVRRWWQDRRRERALGAEVAQAHELADARRRLGEVATGRPVPPVHPDETPARGVRL